MTIAGVRRSSLWAAALVVALVTSSCRPRRAAPQPMPEIPVYVIAPTDTSRLTIAPARAKDPIGDLRASKLVSLTASNADARTILLWLAQQAGVSLVVAPDVTARISVSFTDVPAGDAIRAIIAEAGLSILAPGLMSPWPPVVFFERPVNVNDVSVESIVARFGVSKEMARWIVESRPRP